MSLLSHNRTPKPHSNSPEPEPFHRLRQKSSAPAPQYWGITKSLSIHASSFWLHTFCSRFIILITHLLFTLYHFDYTLSVHASSFWLHTFRSSFIILITHFCSCLIILITHFLSLPHHFTKVKFISFTLQYTILIINNHVLSTPHNLDYIKIIFRSCLLFIPVKASFFTKLFFYCLLLWREKCFFLAAAAVGKQTIQLRL